MWYSSLVQGKKVFRGSPRERGGRYTLSQCQPFGNSKAKETLRVLFALTRSTHKSAHSANAIEKPQLRQPTKATKDSCDETRCLSSSSCHYTHAPISISPHRPPSPTSPPLQPLPPVPLPSSLHPLPPPKRLGQPHARHRPHEFPNLSLSNLHAARRPSHSSPTKRLSPKPP